MLDPTIKTKLFDILERLSPEYQYEVLQLAEVLENRASDAESLPQGMTVSELLAIVEELHFDPANLDTMEQAINEECERNDATPV